MNYINQLLEQYPFLIFFASCLIGWTFMPVVLDIARKKNLVVRPNKRTSHQGSIPTIGGVNIFVSFFLAVSLFAFDFLGKQQFLVLGMFIIIIFGFIDDLIVMKAKWKLLGELSSAFFLIVLSDFRLTNLHGFLGFYVIPDWQSYLLSFFVFIVIINSLNLIDGVDGLASGHGVLYSIFFAIYFHLTGYQELALSAFAIAGSLTVFFIYNVFGGKRKIFMGDSGSLLLGYMITLYVFKFNEINVYHAVPEQYFMAAAPAVSICLLSVPLFDTLRVMLTRIKKGISPFHPDKNHIHHLLLKTGLKHREVTAVLLLVSMFFIGFGLLARNWEIGFLALTAFIIASVLTLILWRIVDKKNQPKD